MEKLFILDDIPHSEQGKMIFFIFILIFVMIISNPHLLEFSSIDDISFQHFPDKEICGSFNFFVILIFQNFQIEQSHFPLLRFGVNFVKKANFFESDECFLQHCFYLMAYFLHCLLDFLPGVLPVQDEHGNSDVGEFEVALHKLLVAVLSLQYLPYAALQVINDLSLRGLDEGKTSKMSELWEVSYFVHPSLNSLLKSIILLCRR